MSQRRVPSRRIEGGLVPVLEGGGGKKITAGRCCNSILGTTAWGMILASLVLIILAYICILSLKNNGVRLMPQEEQESPCLVATGGGCLGICPTGDAQAECPALVFKATDPTSVSLFCTSEQMCQWHSIVATDTPWKPNWSIAPGSQNSHQLEDNRLNELCFQTLDLTDAATKTFFDGGCLKASWQTNFWDVSILGPTPAPVVAKRNQMASRNGLSEWAVVCQIHFACSAQNPAQLRFRVPPPIPP